MKNLSVEKNNVNGIDARQTASDTWIMDTYNAHETFEFGKKMGSQAKSGDIICLNGDLAAGKTVFTQGFAYGLGITEPISSPTFTIVQEYTQGRLPLYHFDVYRLSDISELDEIGYEEYFFSDGVCLVEWGNLFPEIFPEQTIFITIRKDMEKGFDYRKIEIREPFLKLQPFLQ